MDANRFDEVTRLLTPVPSRRDVMRGLVAAGLGFGALRLQEAAEAKKKRKKRKKKKKQGRPKPNAFGCLNVGDACKTADQCCSGICQGKKGKRKCLAHGAGTCDQKAPGICTAPNPALATCNNASDCACFLTTAGSTFCGELFGPGLSQCSACQRDADCVALGLPPESACAPVSQGLCAGTCASGMACLIPCGFGAPPP